MRINMLLKIVDTLLTIVAEITYGEIQRLERKTVCEGVTQAW